MLITPVPPVASATAFSTGLPMFLSGAPGIVKENYLGANPRVPTFAQVSGGAATPQPVFQLSLNEAANNTGTINPPSAGWRFFIGHGVTETVLGRVVQVPPSNTWKLTGVFYGERVSAALVASQDLVHLPDVATNDYELRLLAIPGLNLEVFWLVAQSAGAVDLIIPFPATQHVIPMPPSLNAYSIVTFLALIRPLAGSLLTMPAGYGA
jgi:hypothetical protein